MLTYIFAILLATLMLLALLLNKSYQRVTAKEIKRQARHGDSLAQRLYKPVSYGASLTVLLWLIIVLSATGCFLLVAASLPGWLAFIGIALLMGWGFWWIPATEVGSFSGRLAVWCAPALSKLLYYVHPALLRASTLLGARHPDSSPGGLYEKEDLLELLQWQKQQPDNRIPKSELEIAEHALLFSDRIVHNITIPRRAVRTVSDAEIIGPVFINELHQSGYARFPVYKGKPDHIVGTLYLRDLVNLHHGGTVASAMRPGVFYVHEAFSLFQALQAFLQTKHHLFIVVNSFEEFIGIITVEDVLEQVLGKPIHDEFDRYDDIEAVATALADKQQHQKTSAEPVPESEPLSEPEAI
jgi:CBS domain containing-hemolysin-like protein